MDMELAFRAKVFLESLILSFFPLISFAILTLLISSSTRAGSLHFKAIFLMDSPFVAQSEPDSFSSAQAAFCTFGTRPCHFWGEENYFLFSRSLPPKKLILCSRKMWNSLMGFLVADSR